jgi:hypothetical protein
MVGTSTSALGSQGRKKLSLSLLPLSLLPLPLLLLLLLLWHSSSAPTRPSTMAKAMVGTPMAGRGRVASALP